MVFLIGVPGLAKTRLVETLGIVLGLDWKRIQFTPDLMPADIIGSEVLEEGEGAPFVPIPPGSRLYPIADGGRNQPSKPAHAIRASPGDAGEACHGRRPALRSAAALPCARDAKPARTGRTYPLPEAQLDRFLLQIDVSYPDIEAERRMLVSTTFGEEPLAKPIATPEALIAAQHVVRRLPVGEKVVDAILRLVRAARPDDGGSADLKGSIAGDRGRVEPGLHAGGAGESVDPGPSRAVGR